MKNLKISEIWGTILTMMCAAIPAIFTTIVIESNNNINTILKTILVIFGYVLSAIIFVLSRKICLRIIPRTRPLRQYEGQWLQIIPELKERPFSVITISFRGEYKGYHLCGTNYSKDMKKEVCFDSNKFVETNTGNGFYYITNTTSEYKNGLGKISFIDSNHDHLTRAIGYFFDSSKDSCSKKYNTILIKCDKKFFCELGYAYSNIKIKKLKHNDIMILGRKFAYNELNKNNEKNISRNHLNVLTHNKITKNKERCYRRKNK